MFFSLFLANASFAQQVKTDYDRAATFSQYKTYNQEKVQTPDPLWVDRTKAALDAALAAKGWTQVESGGRDRTGRAVRSSLAASNFRSRD